MGAEPVKLLIVDDSAEDREIYARLLKKCARGAYTIICAETGSEGLASFRADAPECIVLDFNLPDMDALEFLAKMGANQDGLPTAVVLVTGQGSEKVAVETLKLGVHDYLAKGEIDADKLGAAILNAVEKVSARRRAALDRRRLERMALFDPLTGLGNRNLFHARLEHAVALVRRRGDNACLHIMDLDGFKKVNDTLGHHIGDEVLRVIGQRLAGVGRSADTIVRLGGDEFAYLMETGATREGALAVANKVIQLVREPIVTRASVFCLGISIGVAMFGGAHAEVETIIRQADAAMYQAKRGGGGVCIYEPTAAPTAVIDFGKAKRRA
ncbi:MAG TPA: GGDEF domain-containing response regulator [Alphaproteobacteria bacterium]|jgi:diguanylate cyclase (GGDEF)-like protein